MVSINFKQIISNNENQEILIKLVPTETLKNAKMPSDGLWSNFQSGRGGGGSRHSWIKSKEGRALSPFLAPLRSQNMKVTVQQFLLAALLVE